MRSKGESSVNILTRFRNAGNYYEADNRFPSCDTFDMCAYSIIVSTNQSDLNLALMKVCARRASKHSVVEFFDGIFSKRG